MVALLEHVEVVIQIDEMDYRNHVCMHAVGGKHASYCMHYETSYPHLYYKEFVSVSRVCLHKRTISWSQSPLVRGFSDDLESGVLDEGDVTRH